MTVISSPVFTSEDADRLLQLADQFLEDWEENEGKEDPDCVERRKEWDGIRPLLAAAPLLLEACRTLAEDCSMALSGEWDKGDEGFQASRELLESVIRHATGSATSPQLTKTITVKVEGGLVQDVAGLPSGYELRVEDYDGDDTSHPAWVAQKECYVTVYEGGANG